MYKKNKILKYLNPFQPSCILLLVVTGLLCATVKAVLSK